MNRQLMVKFKKKNLVNRIITKIKILYSEFDTFFGGERKIDFILGQETIRINNFLPNVEDTLLTPYFRVSMDYPLQFWLLLTNFTGYFESK